MTTQSIDEATEVFSKVHRECLRNKEQDTQKKSKRNTQRKRQEKVKKRSQDNLNTIPRIILSE